MKKELSITRARRGWEMKANLKGQTSAILIFLGLILPYFISAQITIENPLKAETFDELIGNLINFIFYLAVALVPLMVIIGAFYILTAAGDEKRVTTGKNIITYALIGFVIILFARGIVFVIKGIIGG